MTIAMLFDPQSDWTTTILPQIHAEPFIKTLSCFLDSNKTVGMLSEADVYTTQFWNETTSQDDGTIDARLGFPTSPQEAVFSSAQIGVANPFFQTTRRAYYSNNDYDRVDLTEISIDYLPRNRYQPGCVWETYRDRIPTTPWGTKVSDEYHLLIRRRVGTGSERTLTCAIAACGFAHVNTVISVSLSNSVDMVTLAGSLSSIPCDFVIKCLGRSDIYFSSLNCLPLISGAFQSEIVVRTLLLNCLTKPYAHLWERLWKEEYTRFAWTKNDVRLKHDCFQKLTKGWNSSVPLKTEFERRQALIEIDVLVAMALGMTLEELIAIYQVQFPLLRKSEANTWYDAQGRVTFSISGIQTGVGYDRTEWEQNLKGSPSGKKFYRTITDDTMPGGPIERTIEYVAPFDRCNREQDYETAWRFFEEKYGKGAE